MKTGLWAAVAMALAGVACHSARPGPVRLWIGMTIPQLNVALLDRRSSSSPATPAGLLGVDGPLTLEVPLDEGNLRVQVSKHGGLMLTTDGALSFLQADVEPQPLDAAEARGVAERLCAEARKAGITEIVESSPYNEAGAGCSLRDRKQILNVWIDRFNLTDNGRYRVLLSVASVSPP
jgi:hypothetical protein